MPTYGDRCYARALAVRMARTHRWFLAQVAGGDHTPYERDQAQAEVREFELLALFRPTPSPSGRCG